MSELVTNVGEMVDPSPFNVPWDVRFGPSDKPTEKSFSLINKDGTLRRNSILCPTLESHAVGDALAGREYPLSPKIIDLCYGLPVIDIGAHCGGSIVYWQEMLAPSTIHAYEPNLEASDFIIANAEAGVLYTEAVTNHNRGATFYRRERMYLDGICETLAETVDTYEAPTISGLEALKRIDGPIGVLKIDAECSEAAILLSAMPELHRVRVVYLEYHSELLRRLCDLMLMDFQVFYSKAQGAICQGVMGYVNLAYRDQVWE